MVLIEICREIINTFIVMAPYLLLGLTFAGILHILFSKEFIIRHLGGNDLKSIVKAAVLGVPLPLCSCGVIPTALSLRKSNASTAATVSFLVSTPQTGIDSIIATYGMLGPVFAVFRPFAALVMGIGAGVATMIFCAKYDSANHAAVPSTECPMCFDPSPHKHMFHEKVRSMARYAYVDFLDDISIQLVVGIVLAGLITFFIPEDFFSRYIGNDFAEMALMIVGGIPLYVCATA
ncbi:MAG: permease, partial [Methanosarcinaceae archaeon]|nr:permease [Methanosarcinaceae archaeon]